MDRRIRPSSRLQVGVTDCGFGLQDDFWKVSVTHL
jgi:hypothetical protein